MTASDLQLNCIAKIVSVTHDSLPELGFYAGESIIIVSQALYSGSKVVRVGNSVFALNKAELESIEVKM